MGEGYPRLTLAIHVILFVAAIIGAFVAGWKNPISIFFIAVAALALLGFVLWGLSTAVLLLRNYARVDFDSEGNATISKTQSILALRRTVSRLDERVGSEGHVVLEHLEVAGIRSQVVAEQETRIQSKIRQVLRTDLPVFRRRARAVRLRMERSFCKQREWFEIEMPYFTIDYKLTLSFDGSRCPASIEVYRKKGSAELSEEPIPVTVSAEGDGAHLAIFQRRYLSTAVLYRFEWNWDAVQGGVNDGDGGVTSIIPVATTPQSLPKQAEGPKSLLAGPGGTV